MCHSTHHDFQWSWNREADRRVHGGHHNPDTGILSHKQHEAAPSCRPGHTPGPSSGIGVCGGCEPAHEWNQVLGKWPEWELLSWVWENAGLEFEQTLCHVLERRWDSKTVPHPRRKDRIKQWSSPSPLSLSPPHPLALDYMIHTLSHKISHGAHTFFSKYIAHENFNTVRVQSILPCHTLDHSDGFVHITLSMLTRGPWGKDQNSSSNKHLRPSNTHPTFC